MRSEIALVALLALLTGGCQQAVSAPSGESAFAQSCGTCHQAGQLPGPKRDLNDPRQRAELDRFLARHHASDPAERSAILDYLAAKES